MGNLHKNVQLMLEFLKGSFLFLHFSYYTSMTLLIMLSAVLLSVLTLLSNRKCDQASGLQKQLELAYELESGLQYTVDWGRKCHVDFNARKIQLVSFDGCYNTGAIDVKMNGSVLDEKSFFKMLGLTFSSKLDKDSALFLLLKLLRKNWSLDLFYEVSFP